MENFKTGRHKDQYPRGNNEDQKTINKEREKERFLRSRVSEVLDVRTSHALKLCFPEKEEPAMEDILHLRMVLRGEGEHSHFVAIDKRTGEERPTVESHLIGRRSINAIRDAFKPYGLSLEVQSKHE